MSDDLPCLPCPMTSDDFGAARKNGKRLVCERMYDEMVELRELVRELYHELDAATQYEAGGSRGVVSEFADAMRDLGIEVDQ